MLQVLCQASCMPWIDDILRNFKKHGVSELGKKMQKEIIREKKICEETGSEFGYSGSNYFHSEI